MMVRVAWIVALLALVLSGWAAGDEEALVFRVDKPVEIDVLRSSGLLYLGDVGQALLVLGDDNSVRKMTEAGAAFEHVLSLEPGREIFLLRGRDAAGRPVCNGEHLTFSLAEVGKGTFITAIDPRRINLLDRLACAKTRLLPGAFPGVVRTAAPARPPLVSASPGIQAMVDEVSGDTLWAFMSRLSGREPVRIGSQLDTLLTRYSLSWRIDRAAEYLREKLEAYQVDVAFDPYVVGQLAFYSASFHDPLVGWVVGNDGGAYRTLDGGMTWERQAIAGSYHSLWGVCFVDHDRGWVCGTGGSVYRTRDGGVTWTSQATPSMVTLRGISFIDSLEGWVCGDGGEILYTPDGGVSWTDVESNTTAELYGLDFRSSGRGWACGEDGVILFWNGRSWEPQASGTGEHLMGIDFGDDDSGWAVGRAWTILRTDNGGENWVRQEAPGDAGPFLNDVVAADASEGWIVGLNGTLVHSDDGGESWESQESGTLFGLNCVLYAGDSKVWAVGYGSTVLSSDDRGTNWESLRENLPPEAILRLKNVVATMPGTKSDTVVVLCGHFDSISEDPFNRAPGADDNASGTAAVMEAARILSDYRFEMTIKLICFSGEEQGLFGSGEYVSDPLHAGDRIAGVINLDMIGYTDQLPEDLDIVGNGSSEWLADLVVDCAGHYVPSLYATKIIDPTMVFSDHASFWKGGHSAVLGIEDLDISYPYYHTTSDTLGNLNGSFVVDAVRLGLAAVAHLARPDTVPADPAFPGLLTITAARPNPFSIETGIRFLTAVSGDVEIAVFDVRGRMVKTLLAGELPAGRHTVEWDGQTDDGKRAAAGIYLVGAMLGNDTAGFRIVLLR
jgi:photosystem II stability/assembly factor-like uncharacterized protein